MSPSRPRFRPIAVLLVLLGALALLAAACGSDDTDTEAGADPAGDTTDDGQTDGDQADDGGASGDAAGGGATRPWIAGSWVLQSATGPDGPLSLPPYDLGLTIAGPDSVEGDAGCNTFGGTISAPFDDAADAGDLSLDDLFMTEVACEFLDFEGAYVDLLTSADRWELAPPSGLVFRGEGVELVYGVAQPPADVPLEETLWIFDTVFDGEGVERTASSARADKPEATATINDGVLTLSADDCGPIEIAVSYEADASDGPFSVADGGDPLSDCPDPESNAFTALAGIVEATGFQIFDGRLTLIGLPGETVSFRANDG